MRRKLTLTPLNPETAVPLNYNYPLASGIYKLLAKASPEYADWLHTKGYRSPDDRLMKLFTFSRLNIPRVQIQKKALVARDNRPWLLQLGSPMEDEFVQNFVLGLFEEQKIEIGGPGAVGRFLIETVEALAPPVFKPTMSGKTLSPVVATTMREHNGKLMPYYYRPTDADTSEAIRNNLLAKYEIIHGQPCPDPEIEIRFDMEYFQRKNGKVSKLLHIKEGTAEETKIKAFEMPFKITGNPDLIRTGWECGLGDKNSLGLGMVEVW